jgi:hypothetical protein
MIETNYSKLKTCFNHFKGFPDPVVTIWVVSLCILYSLPLLLSGVMYVDDIYHSCGPFVGMSTGRPMAEVMMRLFNISNLPFVLFPYTQLLASVLIGCSGLLIVENIASEECRPYKIILAISFLVNPFFIQNLSYQFDSITMSLSVFTSILAVIILLNYQKKNFIVATILMTVSCSFYQTGINIFPPVFIIALIARVKDDESNAIVKHVFRSMLAFSIAIFLYKMIASYTTTHQYALEVQKTAPINFSIFCVIHENFLLFLKNTVTLFRGNYGISWCLTIIISLFFFMLNLYQDFKAKNYSHFFLKMLSLPVALFFCLGVLAIQKSPYQPSRVMIGYSGFIFFILYWFLSFKRYNWTKYILVLPVIYSFSLMSSYSNTLKLDDEFTQLLGKSIAYDLINAGYSDTSSFIFMNTRPESEYLKNAKSAFPHVFSNIPIYMEPGFYHGYTFMRRLGIKSKKFDKNTANRFIVEAQNKNISPLVHNLNYSIYNENNLYLIKFNHQ